jgi:hypothetical protein
MSYDRWTRPHPQDYPLHGWSDHQSIRDQIEVRDDHRSTITLPGTKPSGTGRSGRDRGFYWEVTNP